MQIYNNKINFKLVKKLKEVTSIKFSSLCILFNIFAMQYNNRNFALATLSVFLRLFYCEKFYYIIVLFNSY